MFYQYVALSITAFPLSDSAVRLERGLKDAFMLCRRHAVEQIIKLRQAGHQQMNQGSASHGTNGP